MRFLRDMEFFMANLNLLTYVYAFLNNVGQKLANTMVSAMFYAFIGSNDVSEATSKFSSWSNDFYTQHVTVGQKLYC